MNYIKHGTFKSMELEDFHVGLKRNARKMIGYPGNLNNNFSKLFPFFDFLINNVGDPFDAKADYQMDSKYCERVVLRFFHKIYNFNKKGKNSPWGYLTTGGTEGNTMGLLAGRMKYPSGVLYSSESAHYSILKISEILGMMPTIPKHLSSSKLSLADKLEKIPSSKFRLIKSLNHGVMDYDDL